MQEGGEDLFLEINFPKNSKLQIPDSDDQVDQVDEENSKKIPRKPAKKTTYLVEAIVGFRRSLFQVKWVGWGPEFNTWEPLANIGHCTEQLYQFYQSRLKEEEGEGPEEEFEVKQILDHRYSEESLYRVKWVGVAEESWVPESNMTNCPVLLTEFWEERQKELDDLRQEVMVSRENHAMESDLATSGAKPSCMDSGEDSLNKEADGTLTPSGARKRFSQTVPVKETAVKKMRKF